ncbi:MAG: HDOD domain-containing protein [Acidobacteriota bacterium]
MVSFRTIDDLSEKDFNSLYNTGKVKKLNAGETLFTEGEKDQALFLVLKGALASESNRTGASSTFVEGDWIGEVVFLKDPQRISSVAAVTPSSVLALDSWGFKALDPSIQAFILKKLSDSASLRCEEFARSCSETDTINRYLTTHIRKTVRQRNKDIEHSELILNMFRNLPSLPAYSTKLLDIFAEDTATAREVTRLAKEDPSLVGEILKTINSAYYSLNTKVSDIQYAITFLGFNQIYQIVVQNGLRKTMPKTPEFQELHNHSVIIADLVFEICHLHDRKKASTMSTVALLHDIGKSIVMLLKTQNPRLSFFIDMLDPGKLGSMLLKNWNIPELIHQTIEYQDYPLFTPPSELPEEYRKTIAMLFIAHAAYEYLDGNTAGLLKTPFINDYMKVLNFAGMSVPELMDKYVLVDLNMKLDTLPKHVRTFVLAKNRKAQAEIRQEIGKPVKYLNGIMIDSGEW